MEMIRNMTTNFCRLYFVRRCCWTILFALCSLTICAQTAKEVLDKTAAVITAKNGARASFSIKGERMSTNGTIAVKGRKFHVTTPQAVVWFDGKTQWTYLKQNDEVNVATPTEAELQAINPYNFIYLYKQGYTYTMTKKGSNYDVHLTAKDKKRSVQEMYIIISQKSYIPSQIRMKTAQGWNTIEVSNFKQANLSDGTFRFNAKDYPQAEIIDLR